MYKCPVIIVGAGGHAKVVSDILVLNGCEVIGLLSPNEKKDSLCFGIKVLGNDDVLSGYSSEDILLANGIGSLPGENLRWNLAKKNRDVGFKFVSVIHPSAVIADDVEIAEGVQIMAGCVIQSGVLIGRDSIINTGTILEHDSHIGSECHISSGATLSGGVQVDNRTHIGAGTVAIQNILIGSDSIIAAGSVVYRNIPSNITFIQRKDTINLK